MKFEEQLEIQNFFSFNTTTLAFFIAVGRWVTIMAHLFAISPNIYTSIGLKIYNYKVMKKSNGVLTYTQSFSFKFLFKNITGLEST